LVAKRKRSLNMRYNLRTKYNQLIKYMQFLRCTIVYIYFQEKLEKMKQELSRSENEKRHLQKEIRYSESRVTEMEIQRMSLDGDLQRLQMKLQEKEARIEVRNIYNFKKYLTVYKMHTLNAFVSSFTSSSKKVNLLSSLELKINNIKFICNVKFINTKYTIFIFRNCKIAVTRKTVQWPV